MWYSIDYNRLVCLLLPTFLRKAKLVAMLQAFLKPLDGLHYIWILFREANIYKLEKTGQICYLRGALNDTFDPDFRRIYIDGSGGDAEKTFIYNPAENQTKYLGTLYIRTALEFADNGADFLVYMPSSIVATQIFELEALIDFYKLAGKRYLIIEI